MLNQSCIALLVINLSTSMNCQHECNFPFEKSFFSLLDLTNISDLCFRFTDGKIICKTRNPDSSNRSWGPLFYWGSDWFADSVDMASRLMAKTRPRLVKAWFLLVMANNVRYFEYIFQCTVFCILSKFSNVQYFEFRNSCYYEH